MSDCFVLYLLLTCMKKKTSGADKFTNNNLPLLKLKPYASFSNVSLTIFLKQKNSPKCGNTQDYLREC